MLTVVDLPESTCLEGYVSVLELANKRGKQSETNPMTTTLICGFSSLLETKLAMFAMSQRPRRPRARLEGESLPHFDGVGVLENETGDLRYVNAASDSQR